MRVAFDSRPLSDPNGVGRYARCLLHALRETASSGDEVLETHKASAPSRSLRADVFHSPWMAGAMLRSPCPAVVTLHDVAVLKRRSEYLRSGMRVRLRNLAMQRAASVIVPTEAVGRDAVGHLRLERERVVVIPEAADATMYPRSAHEVAAVRSSLSLPDEYLVWVGDLQHPDPSKHVAQLAAAPRRLPLVLVGEPRQWARELPGVILAGHLDDAQLAAVYSGAHALVLPSEEEGFGLPAVEALACGTPVIACDIPSLREALGERATFVARGNIRTLIEAAERVSRPAPPPLSWTWEDAARATWGVYQRAAAPAPRAGARAIRRGAPARGIGSVEP